MAGPAPGYLSIIVFSGACDRVHYALCMASAAAAMDRPVRLFFTMGGLRVLQGANADGVPGWARLDAAEDGTLAATRDADFAEAGIATFEELLAALVGLDADFLACDAGLRALGLTAGDLRPELSVQVGGLAELFAGGAGGERIFI